MEIVALFVAAFLQLATLSLDQLRQTIDAIASALAQQYVDATDGARLGDMLTHELERGRFAASAGPDAFSRRRDPASQPEMKRAGGENRQPFALPKA